MKPIATLMLTLILTASFPALAADSTVVVVVRHAEKATDDPRDPTLSEAGQARAQALAATFEGAPLTAAFSTQYRRTRLTAEPAAAAAGIAVQVRPVSGDNAATYAHDLAREIRALPAGSVVLVVGHSDTVPELVEALGGRAAPMDETEYDRYTVVVLDADGKARTLPTAY